MAPGEIQCRPATRTAAATAPAMTRGYRMLGRAKRVIVTKDETTVVDGAGDAAEIEGRINQIRTEIDSTDSDYDREKRPCA